MDQRIVDDDLFRLDLLAVLHDGQLRPPPLGRAVGVIFLPGAITLDRERELFPGAGAKLDDVTGLTFLQHQKTAVTEETIDDSAGEVARKERCQRRSGRMGEAPQAQSELPTEGSDRTPDHRGQAATKHRAVFEPTEGIAKEAKSTTQGGGPLR